jgi:alpha-beta hydrolase superfamily lysophospholipase
MKIRPDALVAGMLLGGAVWAVGTHGFTWLATHPLRLPVRRLPRESLELEEVAFPARDGIRIAGWFASAPNAQGAVILCHGHPMNRMEMLPWARLLHAAGFHVLLFDFRSMGESEGDLCSIGHLEVNDLLGAVDYLVRRPEMYGLEAGVFGISMGGAAAIMAAAQDERIAAVATHGAYASLERAIQQRGRMLLGPAGPLLAASATYWARRWIDTDPRSVSPQALVAQIAPRPVLISHGRMDLTINPEDAHALYSAAGTPKTLNVLPNSWHVRIGRKDRPGYERRLIRFFTDGLRAEAPPAS